MTGGAKYKIQAHTGDSITNIFFQPLVAEKLLKSEVTINHYFNNH